MLKKPLPRCSTLPPTALQMINDHNYNFWKQKIEVVIKLKNKDAILARLLIHLRQRQNVERLIQLVEEKIEYVDKSGVLVIRQKLFRRLVKKSFPKAILTAKKYPLYLKEEERIAYRIAA